MAEARINPDQLKQAVNVSLQRALQRDKDIITRPILIGIIAYPRDDGRLDFNEIQASELALDTSATNLRSGG